MRSIVRALGCIAALGLAGCAGGNAATSNDDGTGDAAADAPSVDPGPGSDAGNAAPNPRASGDAGGRGGSGAAISAACLAAGQAVCARTSQCSSFLFQLREADAATCASRYALLCETQANAPGSHVTPAFIQACGSATAAASCNDLFDGVPPAECKAPSGELADGAACGESTQCANSDCRKASGSYCGTCATPAGEGGSCASADCSPGLQCMSDHVCRPLAAAGSSCGTTEHCQFPLVCKGGTCSPPDAEGATCSGSSCDATKGLICNPNTKQCVAATLEDAGKACGVISGAPYVCGGGALCKFASANAPSGICLAPASDGDSCSATEGPGCDGPAYCSSGKCTLPDPTACK